MTPKSPLLICVVGPTAIGKTALAIEIALAFSTEIISADSRQFYQEMTIGTAVPTSEELAKVPHHFIQNKSITERYSVGDYEKEAIQKLNELYKKHQTVVLVGGSGLYVDAVVNGLDNFPEISPEIRAELNQIFKNDGIKVLQEELRRVDPKYFNEVDTGNHHRLIRALEIYRSTGKPYSSFLKKKSDKRSFDTIYIGIRAERELIYDRINQRVDIMMKQGLKEEAQNLHAQQELNALQTVGYRELFKYFEGEFSLEQATDEIKKNTRRYAKRQGTWYRKNKEVNWFDFPVKPLEVIKFIKEKSAQK